MCKTLFVAIFLSIAVLAAGCTPQKNESQNNVGAQKQNVFGKGDTPMPDPKNSKDF